MPKRFLPTLEAPSHRRIETEARRPCLCLGATFGVILLVFTIFGLSAWNVFMHRFDKNTFELHSGDEASMSLVSDDLSPTFCDGYEVTLGHEGEVYLLPHRATVNTTIVDTTKIFIHQEPGKAYTVRGAYLLEDSVINVTACRENGSSSIPGSIVLIRGPGNLKKWREDRSCRHCVLQQVPVFPKSQCLNEESKHANLRFTVDYSAHYFLIISYGRPLRRRGYRNDGIRLNGTLARTRYDVTNAKETCQGKAKDKIQLKCVFDLPWQSDMDVVIRIDDLREDREKRDVHTRCRPRLVFWICIFGVVPLGCTLPISLLFGCFLCRRTTRSFQAVKRLASSREKPVPIDKEELVHNEVRIASGEDEGCMAIQDG